MNRHRVSRRKRGWQRFTILILMVSLLMASCTRDEADQKSAAGPPVKVRIATTNQVISALVWIARSQGFFAENSLDVTIVETESGIASHDLLEKQEVDFALLTDFAFIKKAAADKDLMILASIAAVDNNVLIAKRESGVDSIEALHGKTIALKKGSSADYFFAMFAAEHNLDMKSMTLMDLPPSKQLEALGNNEVDGIATWEPNASAVQEILGEHAISWGIQGGEKSYWLLVTEQDRVAAPVLERLLLCLFQSEKFLQSHVEDAKEIVAEQTSNPPTNVERAWSNTRFGLSLPRELLTIMEFRSTWIFAADGEEIEDVNFLDRINFAPLEKTSSNAVTIIH